MTAADAATKQAGDPLNLDGTAVRVTLVDESRVCDIEGEAPEGVEVGDVARYFNAESGNTMQVVSWTGEEVEYFRGKSLRNSAFSASLRWSLHCCGALGMEFRLQAVSASHRLQAELQTGSFA